MIRSLKELAERIAEESPALTHEDLKLQLRDDTAKDKLRENELPTEIADLIYKDFDGQSYGCRAQILSEFRLTPLSESLERWADLYSFYQMKCGEPGDVSFGDQAVKREFYYYRNWFPFAWDQVNNADLILDFEPTRHGKAGQVLHKSGSWDVYLVATDLPSLLNRLLEGLRKTEFRLETVFPEFEARTIESS